MKSCEDLSAEGGSPNRPFADYFMPLWTAGKGGIVSANEMEVRAVLDGKMYFSIEELKNETKRFFHDILERCYYDFDEGAADKLDAAFWEDVAVHVLLNEMLVGKHEGKITKIYENEEYLNKEIYIRLLKTHDDRDYSRKKAVPDGCDMNGVEQTLLLDVDNNTLSMLSPLILYYIFRYKEIPYSTEDFDGFSDGTILSLFYGENKDYIDFNILQSVAYEVYRIIKDEVNDEEKETLQMVKDEMNLYAKRINDKVQVDHGRGTDELVKDLPDILRYVFGLYDRYASKRAKGEKVKSPQFNFVVNMMRQMEVDVISYFHCECVLYGLELITNWVDYMLFVKHRHTGKLLYPGIALKVAFTEISSVKELELAEDETKQIKKKRPKYNASIMAAALKTAKTDVESAFGIVRFWEQVEILRTFAIEMIEEKQWKIPIDYEFDIYGRVYNELFSEEDEDADHILGDEPLGCKGDLCEYILNCYDKTLEEEISLMAEEYLGYHREADNDN